MFTSNYMSVCTYSNTVNHKMQGGNNMFLLMNYDRLDMKCHVCLLHLKELMWICFIHIRKGAFVYGFNAR